MGDVKLHVYHSLHIRAYRLQILGPCMGPKVEPKPSPEILLEARLSLAQTVTVISAQATPQIRFPITI